MFGRKKRKAAQELPAMPAEPVAYQYPAPPAPLPVPPPPTMPQMQALPTEAPQVNPSPAPLSPYDAPAAELAPSYMQFLPPAAPADDQASWNEDFSWEDQPESNSWDDDWNPTWRHPPQPAKNWQPSAHPVAPSPPSPSSPSSPPSPQPSAPTQPPMLEPQPSTPNLPQGAQPSPLAGAANGSLGPCVKNNLAKLMLDDGQSFPLAVPIVIGRRPEASATYPAAMLLALNDESKRLSKTHVLVHSEAGVAKVRDLNSRNGVIIENKSSSVRVVPMLDVEVPVGAKVHVGGRSFTIIAN